MKNILFAFQIIVLLMLFASCESPKISKKQEVSESVDSIPKLSAGIKTRPDPISYFAAKAKVEARRAALATAFFQKKITIDSARTAFTESLLDEIIPFWYGTKWSFEGYTDTPQKGQIACGYFVSTILLDAGLRLNRFKLAQQSPVDEAKMLALGGDVREVSRASSDSSGLVFQQNFRDGLYFVGLGGSHVGFFLKKNGGHWFIHSNYTSPQEVLAQPISGSVFMSFGTYFFADLTFNDRLLEFWLAGKEVPLSIEETELIEIK